MIDLFNETRYADEVYDKLLFTDSRLSGKEFQDCTFLACDFSNSSLLDCNFIDCRFEACNLSNIKLGNTALKGVCFENSKLLVTDFTDCSDFLFAVRFGQCVLDYAFFIRKNLKKTVFDQCSVREANFSESNLAEASFLQCDLHQTVFERTDLRGADFRTAFNYSINPTANNLRKARFSYPSVLGLLDSFGVKVS